MLVPEVVHNGPMSRCRSRALRIFGGTLTLSLVLGAVALVFSGVLSSGRTASASADPVIAAAGDIACDPSNSNFNGGQGKSGACQQLATYTVLQQINPVAVLALGDNQYYCGGYQAFLNSYALSWGQLLSKTYPSVGNHEYLTSGGTGCDSSNQNAAGYWRYYAGAADEGNAGQGWYSFDVGSWHLIALNSNCSQAGGCGTGSPQYNWLAADLAAHPHQCLLAYWHIPLFSSGGRANQNSHSFWNLLYAAHADVVLNGHDHIYERFARADAVRPAGHHGRHSRVHRRHRRREPHLDRRARCEQRGPHCDDLRCAQADAACRLIRLGLRPDRWPTGNGLRLGDVP